MIKGNIATVKIIFRDSKSSDVIAIKPKIEAMRVDYKVYNLPWLYILKCIVELNKCTSTTLTSLLFNFKVN